MSLGGYKWAGNSIQKSDYTNLTDKQWALAVHKCRVKTFLDSLALTQAAWECSRDDGEINLDTNHQGYIHIIEVNANSSADTYQGYATYFKYMENNQVLAYYLILTLPDYQICLNAGDSNKANGKVDVYIKNMLQSYASSKHQFWTRGITCFYALSLEDFGTHPREQGFIPTKSTKLIPCGGMNGIAVSSYPYALQNNSYDFIQGSTAVSFGVCTKSGSPDIIDFCKDGNSNDLNWNINIISPRAFSQNMDNTDQYKLASIKVRAFYNGGASTYGEITNPNSSCLQHFTQILNKQGDLYWGYYTESSHSPNTWVGFNYLPAGDINNARMYSSFYVKTPDGPKGFINPELVLFSWQDADRGTAYSNGKYLCISSAVYNVPVFYAGVTSNTEDIKVFIGWDESNPDISLSSAAPNYIPDVSFPTPAE